MCALSWLIRSMGFKRPLPPGRTDEEWTEAEWEAALERLQGKPRQE